MSNIFAYTAPDGSYPRYVSINLTRGGDIEVTVRGDPFPERDHLSPSTVASALIPLKDWPENWEFPA